MKEDGSAPAVGEADVSESRMQVVDAALDGGEEFTRRRSRDIDVRQVVRVWVSRICVCGV